jgi:hypothetical protein
VAVSECPLSTELHWFFSFSTLASKVKFFDEPEDYIPHLIFREEALKAAELFHAFLVIIGDGRRLDEVDGFCWRDYVSEIRLHSKD